jgi:ubiquinone/menaquinone biosynthesis C-methylase UbiE
MLIFLYGPDSYRSRQKLNEIIGHYKNSQKSGLNLVLVDADKTEFEEFYNNLRSSSMFKEKKLVVLKNLFLNKVFQESFLEVLKKINVVNGPILDVGCHGGTFTKKILDKLKSKEIYGVDISHRAIDLVRKRMPYGHFEVADAASLPFKDNFFEAVFCLEVLEHVDNPTQVLSEIKRVLKKGGYAIFLVPSDNKLFKLVWFLWTLYYPVWKHAHVQSFSGSVLENYILNTGFKIEKVKNFNLGMLKLIVARKN